MPTIYLRGRLKVLVAECTSHQEIVGRMSRIGWEIGKEILASEKNIECNIVEIRKLDDLRRSLGENDYDVLVVSAHGGVDSEQNKAGFVCGDKLVVDEDLGSLPKIVCLSACQISPRSKALSMLAI